MSLDANSQPKEKQTSNYHTTDQHANSVSVRQKSQPLLEALIENSFDLLALIDENGKYLYVSESVYQTLNYPADALLGYKANQLIGTNSFSYMHPEDLPLLMEQFSLLFKGEKKIQVRPFRFRSAEGLWHWMEAIVTNQLAHPDIQAIVVSCRDITHQVEIDTRLKEMHVMEALMEGEEKERNRIARDLHDGVAGMIAAAKMHFSVLVHKEPHLGSHKEYEQGMHLLDVASELVRTTSHNLMTELLLENGLTEALARFCHSISNQYLKVEFISIGFEGPLSPNFELSLYRISQELIGNIIKHAKATKALVQLSYQDKLLTLTIEDNGIGFNTNQLSRGTGLNSIQKRVESMNGRIELDAAPGKGTSVYLEFEI